MHNIKLYIYIFIYICVCVCVCDTLRKFRFSGSFGVFYELGQYDLLYTLWDHTSEHETSYGSMCRVHPWTPENQIPP